MRKVVHKLDFKRKFEKYIGFGQKMMCPSVLCVGARGIYEGKRYEATRNWKNVTCKHCLRKKPIDKES